MKYVKIHQAFVLTVLLAANLCLRARAAEQSDVPGSKPTPYLTAEEELKTIKLPEGYSLELVVGDPIIRDPVVSAFDGNGRMYVAEMRTYMQDIDGTDEHLPTSRISLHESTKHDGVFDRHTVFIDHLLLPRMILPLADGILVNETDSEDLWLYRDTDGDGVADKKELVYNGGRRGGNLEHQPSGLIWDRDNWIYQAVNSYRLRLKGTNFVREPTPANNGQWGLAQDDYGKLWFVNAGAELGPTAYQQPIVYGNFTVRDEPSQSFMEVWPLVGLADVEGGAHRFRPEDKTLNHFTGCCGPDIFRGDRLPEDLRGDLLFGEPVGRLIRRAKNDVTEGVTRLRNPYEKSEFIRSTDPNFRPINMITAPDGTLYIVDMYRGIIQEGNWVRQGTYLRKPVQQNQLYKNFGRGRIWRLKHKDFQPGPQPHMLDESSAQLVDHLAHPNGWWRDTAQKLLVLRADKSVAPALIAMARGNQNPLARIGALWTLEGIGELTDEVVRHAFEDKDEHVRAAAIRASETLYKNNDHSLVADIKTLGGDANANVAIQAMMTANLLRWPDSREFIQSVLTTNAAAGVQEVGQQMLQPRASLRRDFTVEQRRTMERGEVIYKQLCFSCHGTTGRGMPLQGAGPGVMMAPTLAGSKIVNGVSDGFIDVVLKGLTGPNGGKNYSAQMVPMENNDDQWMADITSYIRNSFGNRSGFVRLPEVAHARAAAKARNTPWTMAELQTILPQAIGNQEHWKVTASHNSRSARLAIDDDIKTRFDTATDQVPGMWYQVELPEETAVMGLQMDAAESANDYPRGYRVELSNDGKSWGQPVATGRGNNPLTEVFFPATKCKFVRITQTGSVGGLYWSIHELKVFTPGSPVLATSAAAKDSKSKFE